MADPRICASAFTAVVQGVFLEDCGQSIARCGSNGRNDEVGTESLSESLSPLVPLWRRVAQLVDAGRDRCTGKWIWTVRVEEVIAEFDSLCRRCVGKVDSL